MVKIWNELRILQCLNHKYIVACRQIYHWHDQIFIVLEDAGSKTLAHFLQEQEGRRCRSPDEVRHFSMQIVEAMVHCHLKMVGHRNICWDTIMVQESNQIKLVGFGSSKRCRKERQDVTGTMPFMAPEVLLQKPHESYLVDIWSAGILTLEMAGGMGWVCSRLGWMQEASADNYEAIGQQISNYFTSVKWSSKRLRLKLESWSGPADKMNLPETYYSLLSYVLQVNPKKRWSCKQLEVSAWLVSR